MPLDIKITNDAEGNLEVTLRGTPDALVRALVDDAGKKVGLGDYRPERKGPFGKFVVTKWEEAKEAKPKAA